MTESIQEFDEHVENLRDSREEAYASASGPRVHSHFMQYQADVVRHHMRKDLRENVGLGSPPARFTTNASESLNAAIKRKVNFKESDWPQFLDMKQYGESQREEVIRALSGRGQYRLCTNADHYGVPTQSWAKMTAEQRREVVSAFDKAKLPRRAESQTEESSTFEPDHPDNGSTGGCKRPVLLSVSAEDSGIVSIPLVTLNAMWHKASELLSDPEAITPAPGYDPTARMVLSATKFVYIGSKWLAKR